MSMSLSFSEDASSNSSSLRQIGNSKVTVKAMMEPDSSSPIISPLERTHISNLAQSKHHRASLSKRLSGRAAISPTPSPELVPHRASHTGDPSSQTDQTFEQLHGNLVTQLSQWLHHEKEKRSKSLLGNPLNSSPLTFSILDAGATSAPSQPTEASYSSDTDAALEKLEKILRENDHLANKLLSRSPTDKHRFFPRRKSSLKPRLRRLSHTAGSSDTDYYEGDAVVPGVDATLDNTKTLGFIGGAASSQLDLSRTISKSVKEESWLQFKNEIIRLTHTLRIKGWRAVPLEGGTEIDVQRLSGALTNAVYVVTPPKRLSKPAFEEGKSHSQGPGVTTKRGPK